MSHCEDLVTLNDDCTTRLNLLRCACAKNGISLNRDTKILDIGSWNGVLLDYLQRKWFTFVRWIDRNPRHKSKFPDLNVVEGDIHDMPFEDNYFDVIISNWVFDQRIYGNHNTPAMMKEIQRVLKPQGLYTWIECDADLIQEYVQGSAYIIINGKNLSNI